MRPSTGFLKTINAPAKIHTTNNQDTVILVHKRLTTVSDAKMEKLAHNATNNITGLLTLPPINVLAGKDMNR